MNNTTRSNNDRNTYTLTEARALWVTMTRATLPTCPLRLRTVIILAPQDGRFCVTTLGFATANGFTPVSAR